MLSFTITEYKCFQFLKEISFPSEETRSHWKFLSKRKIKNLISNVIMTSSLTTVFVVNSSILIKWWHCFQTFWYFKRHLSFQLKHRNVPLAFSAFIDLDLIYGFRNYIERWIKIITVAESTGQYIECIGWSKYYPKNIRKELSKYWAAIEWDKQKLIREE